MHAAVRLFSTARRTKLMQALHNTHTHEKVMLLENRDVKTFLSRSNFELEQQGRHVTLRKEVSGYGVKVDFQAKALIEDTDESVEFQVEVAREDASLVFKCSRAEDALRVLSLQHSSLNYPGPVFCTLDSQLQALLAEFLHSLSITSDFALFVETCAIDTEQHLYLQWLQDTRNLLKLSQ